MPVSPAELTLLIVGAVVAGFVQGLSGFGFSMVAMSIWVWGLSPPLAAAMGVFGSLTGQVVAAFSVRRSLALTTLAPFLAGGLLGIPLGVWLLPRLDVHAFKLVLGSLLVVVCPAMLLSSRLPAVRLPGPRSTQLADGVAGVAGGVMGGLGGFTGVAPTLWCSLRGFDKDGQRTVIQNFNLATLAVTMAAYVATGAVTQPMWPLLPWVAAAVVLPAWLGTRFYRGLGQTGFRRVVLSLLTAAGLVMLVSALPKVLA
ncbi:MAG TPA: sulfite exporter TauE/SafE family protein [Burkholderiaceae bacterium]|nr:sulfite exporter TauE/SafE family protein [Burkholderiaceae bacterium]